MTDEQALETREATDHWFGDPREQGSGHPDAAKEDLMATQTEFPTDSAGLPLAWPDPGQPNWYVDAWNGIYDSREFALAESRDWVATEAERTLAYGEAPRHDDDCDVEVLDV